MYLFETEQPNYQKTIEDFTCPECGMIDKANLIPQQHADGRTHMRVETSCCKRFLKWYSQNQSETFVRGKHKGKEVKHCWDRDYLEYCITEKKLNENRSAMIAQLQRIKNRDYE